MNNKFEKGEQVMVTINLMIPGSTYKAEVLKVPPFSRAVRNGKRREDRYKLLVQGSEKEQVYYADGKQLKEVESDES